MSEHLNLTPDRMRLFASLGFNFLAKVPGIIAVFVILPLVSRALGTAVYGELLSALALGSVFTLPFGGINTVGRRLLASAYGAKDQTRQANAFITTTSLTAVVALITSIIIVGTTACSWSNPSFIFVSLLPIVASFFNGFDNARASFNEHYVTAAFQLVSQIVLYLPVYILGLPKGSIVLSALTLQAPYLLASVATLAILLLHRRYLCRGKIIGLTEMLAPALGVVLADGALAVLLNLSVYWLKVAGSPEMAAWFGTFARLFQSFLSPVLLILFPVTTYISSRWSGMSMSRQLFLYQLFILMGLGYGLVVGCAIAFAGPLYINHMFRLTAHGDSRDVLAISLFAGAIIAQKAYTMLLYAISEARFVSYGTAITSTICIVTALASSHWLPPQRVIDVLFVFMGISLPTLLLVAHYRYKHATLSAEPKMSG